MIKIQLFNDQLGPLVVNPDAIGTTELDQILKRSEKDDGVTYDYTLDLDFTKKAREYLRYAYENLGGIEAVVTVNVYEYDENSFNWEIIGEGKIKFINWAIDAEKGTTNIEETGFQRKVINLIDVDVDLETLVSQSGSGLPATPTVTLTLHPKKIVKSYVASPTDPNEFAQGDVFEFVFSDDGDDQFEYGVVYGSIDTGDIKFKELEDSFTLPYGYAFMNDIAQWSAIVAGFDVYDIGFIVYHGGSIYRSLIDNNQATPGSNPAAWDLVGMAGFLQYSDIGPRSEQYRAKELGTVKIDVRLKLKHSVFSRNDGGDVDICGSGSLGNVLIQAWYEHRREDNTLVSITQIGSDWSTPGCGGTSRLSGFETKTFSIAGVPALLGDKFYVYYTASIYGTYEQPNEGAAGAGHVWHELRVQADKTLNADGNPETYISIVSETEFPATTSKSILIHEAFKKIFQFYTDQEDCFYSEYFGRTDSSPAYAQDGPGSLVAVLNGRGIRQLENQTIFASGQDMHQSANAINCLGMGFEIIDGKQKVRVEPKRHFYNKNDLILDLGVVSKLKKKVATKYYYNQVESGFGKLDVQQTNGIDEFTTLRKYKLPITQVNSKLNIVSKYKASGFEIESQRRLIGSTKDSKLDDANFFVNVVRDGGGFKPEKAENYPVVENLYDSASAYNLDFAPRRILENWKEVFAGCVAKIPNKVMTFSSGEGNYFMRSRRSDEAVIIDEHGSLDLTNVEALWYPEIYSFEKPLSRDQMRIIRQKPYGYFKFREIEDGPVLEGYLLKVARNSNKKLGIFEVLRVYRPIA